MSTRPNLPDSNVFNPSLFSYENDYLTLADADLRYVRIGGDIVANSVSCNTLYLAGDLLDVGVITGITHGTISADKAVIVDSNKDITGFRNLSSTSISATTLTLNGSFNFGSNVNTTMNNNLIITGSASSPTTTNGLGFAFNPMTSTGRIKSYNYVLGQYNHLDINDGALFVKSDSKIGVNTQAPTVPLDVNGQTRITSKVRDALILKQTDPALRANILFQTAGQVDFEIGLRGNDWEPKGGLYMYQGTSYRFIIQANGNVGINQNTSAYTLGINGTLSANGIVSFTNTTDSSAFTNGALVVSGGIGIAKNLFVGGSINGLIATGAQTNITSVGTLSSLSSSGQISSTSNFRCTRSTGGSTYISTCGTSNYQQYHFADGDCYMGTTTANDLVLTTNNLARLRITSGGAISGISTLTATTLNGTLGTGAQPNITSLGTLSSLTVTGACNATLSTGAQPNITSLGTLSSLTVSGACNATISTGAQPNITSLGTLSSLTVSGACNATLSTASQPNITSLGTLTSLTVSGACNATLSTGAQPNITSLGTLSSLTVSGACNATLSTGAQPNITSLGTLTSLTVSGNAECNALRVGSAVDPDFKIHITGAANDRILALYNTSTGAEFYGFGANSNSVMYHSNANHRWYLGSTGLATGTKYMDLSSAGLFTSGYNAGSAGNVLLSSLSSAYSIVAVCNSSFASEGNGIAFIAEATGFQLPTTPCASIRCYRTGGWAQGGLKIATKGANSQTGALVDRMTISETGVVSISNATDATSITTGALTVAGGMSCGLQCVASKFSTSGEGNFGSLRVGSYLCNADGNDLSKTRITTDGLVYANKCLITDANSDIGTIRRCRVNQLLVGSDFTDTTRLISCLDASIVVGSTRFITLGYNNTSKNTGEISYYHAGSGNNLNALQLGLHTTGAVLVLRGDKTINTSTQELFNSSGELTSRINTEKDIIAWGAGTIRSYNAIGIRVYNESESNICEGKLSCSSYNFNVASQSTSALRLYSGSYLHAYFGGSGSNNICFHGSSTSYPVSILKSDGISYSSYHYWNSGGADGTGSSTGATVSLYTSGRILCTGEIDVISDARVKSDIDYIKQKFVDRFIDELEPKCFKYKQESDLSYGYIAQDCIKAGLSRFVQMHPSEGMEEMTDDNGFLSPAGIEFSINTAYFIPLLHMKVKQQSKEIANMQKQINALIEKISRLTEL